MRHHLMVNVAITPALMILYLHVFGIPDGQATTEMGLGMFAGTLFPDVDVIWSSRLPFEKWNILTGHRGITHHPFMPIALFLFTASVLIALPGWETAGVIFWHFFSIGVLLHLLMDAFSPLGLPRISAFSYGLRWRLPTLYTMTDNREEGLFASVVFAIAIVVSVLVTHASFSQIFYVVEIALVTATIFGFAW